MVSIMKGSSGLNTQSDMVRSGYRKDPSPYTGVRGLVDFAACMNVDISDAYRVSRRRGITRQVALASHSLHPVGEKYCLFVSGSNLNLLLPSLTEYTTIASVTQGLNLSCSVLDDTAYWLNGAQKGKVVDGANQDWTMGEVISNNRTRQYFDPPMGQFLGFYNGRMYIGAGQEIWYSEDYGPDVFALGDSYLAFESVVTMIRPVAGGMYVSEADTTWFLSGTNPQEFTWLKVDDHGALPYSDTSAVGAMVEGSWIPGGKQEVAFWLTNEGIMYGDATGNVSNITEAKIDLVSPSIAGATLIDGSTLIAQFI